jgi:hypothetical protein
MTHQRTMRRRGRSAAVFALGLLGGHLISRLNTDSHGDAPTRPDQANACAHGWCTPRKARQARL